MVRYKNAENVLFNLTDLQYEALDPDVKATLTVMTDEEFLAWQKTDKPLPFLEQQT